MKNSNAAESKTNAYSDILKCSNLKSVLLSSRRKDLICRVKLVLHYVEGAAKSMERSGGWWLLLFYRRGEFPLDCTLNFKHVFQGDEFLL